MTKLYVHRSLQLCLRTKTQNPLTDRLAALASAARRRNMASDMMFGQILSSGGVCAKECDRAEEFQS